MALRTSTAQLSRRMSQAVMGSAGSQRTSALVDLSRSPSASRCFATAHTHRVVQTSAGSKGPTAMVFLNMGGPSTVDEVGDFLSRLFVCCLISNFSGQPLADGRLLHLGRWRLDTPWSSARVPRALDFKTTDSQDPKAVRSHRRRLSHPKMVRIPKRRNVQDPRRDIARDSPAPTLRCLSICRPSHRGDVQQVIGRRIWQRQGRSGRSLHTIPPVLLFHDGEQPERALEVEATTGKQRRQPYCPCRGRLHRLECYRQMAGPSRPS